MWSELRKTDRFVIVTESPMQIGGHATSAIGRYVTIMKPRAFSTTL